MNGNSVFYRPEKTKAELYAKISQYQADFGTNSISLNIPWVSARIKMYVILSFTKFEQ